MSDVEATYFDPGIAVKRGLYTGVSSNRKFGHAFDLGTSWATVWTEQAGVYVPLTTATIMKISSASVNDVKTTGTGAWTVRVWGLDANYDNQTEDIDLNGQTAVNTLNTYMEINRMKVIAAGSGKMNAGIIYAGTGTVTSGVPLVKHCSITFNGGLGYNQSLFGHQRVPRGYTGYVTHYGVSSDKANKPLRAGLFMAEFGEVCCVKDTITLVQDHMDIAFHAPEQINEKGSIQVRAIADGADTEVSAYFVVKFVKN